MIEFAQKQNQVENSNDKNEPESEVDVVTAEIKPLRRTLGWLSVLGAVLGGSFIGPSSNMLSAESSLLAT